MRWVQAILAIIILIALNPFDVGNVAAKDSQAAKHSKATIGFSATLKDANGTPRSDVIVEVEYDNKHYQAKTTTDKEGKFVIGGIDLSKMLQIDLPGTLTDSNGTSVSNANLKLIHDGKRYKLKTDQQGKFTIKAIDLSKTLQERRASDRMTPFLLIIAGLLGLAGAAFNDFWEKKKAKDSDSQTEYKNRFLLAFWNASIWVGILGFLAYRGGGDLHFFSPDLTFGFYVPVFGFLGALLYVLDLSRRGKEDIPKGTEFGMRLIMGPYVAIVMVVLFGRNLHIVNLETPAEKGALAFFSGLLVVSFLQQLVESGQEKLGRWRQKVRYEPSEIAKEFNLSREEDLKLVKAGIRYLCQLEELQEDALREEARKVDFDENLVFSLKKKVIDIKRQDEREQLQKAIGALVWGKLKSKNVKTIEDLAHLSDGFLEEIAKADPQINANDLKTLRNKSKKFGLIQFPYQPSEIARKFELSPEEDYKLRKAEIRYLVQLGEYKKDVLTEKARNVGFDENLAIGLKIKYEKEHLEKAIGSMVWKRLENINVKTINDFAHLSDGPLEEIAKADPRIDVEDLKKLRDQAKKFGLI